MAAVTVMIPGCGGDNDSPATPTPTPAKLQAAYQAAILDAKVAEPDEIYRNLVAITPYNPDLIWSGAPGASNVLVVTWTSWDGYATGPWNMGNHDTWVTVAPEVQEYCRALSGNYFLRMEQLLGLPPQSGQNYFVEMWVSPENLFRPSPDPEITDHEAELNFPYYVDDDYRTWFNTLEETSYTADGYPWTRLGYTYDWGNPKSEVGLSEFVIKRNADVEVKGIYANEEYCDK